MAGDDSYRVVVLANEDEVSTAMDLGDFTRVQGFLWLEELDGTKNVINAAHIVRVYEGDARKTFTD